MSLQELQKYTTVSKYSRWMDEKQRREVWPEPAGRYGEMLKEKYPERAAAVDEVVTRIAKMDVMPSMRGLQFGGKPIFKQNARLYNCSGSYCDRLRFFAEGFYLLLCGSGVGFSVQERHTCSLPNISQKRFRSQTLAPIVHVIEDSIEGWSDAVSVLLSSWFDEPIKGFERYQDRQVEFDYSQIRKKGSKLSYGIGRAPGPMPLARSLKACAELLKTVAKRGNRLKPIDAYDLFMHLAVAVVSGGVRRSATLCLFDPWDVEMASAKTGNWFEENPQRGRSNNSAALLRGSTRWEEFRGLFESTRQFGEPGFFWLDHPDGVTNPCAEIQFNARMYIDAADARLADYLKWYQGPVSKDGDEVVLSGFQMCNLTTINGKTVQNADDFHERCVLGARLGTWQKGFDSFPYLGPVTEAIVRREGLLGVSIAGMMHHPEIFLDPATLRKGAAIVLETDEKESFLLGLNPAARATCVKPDGNSASALGSFSGVHPGKMRRGFRIVQANHQEAAYQHFKSVNPLACEHSVWNPNGTDDVIRFCVEYEGLMEEDMTALEMLANVRLIQENWVRPGAVPERCTRYYGPHNTSNTVRVREHEWDGVAEYLYQYRESFSGVSFIAATGHLDYPQAPFTAVRTFEELINERGSAAVSDAPSLIISCKSTFRDLWDAASVISSGRELSLVQSEWIDALQKYEKKYSFESILQAVNFLKEVYNTTLYEIISNSYQPVDYTTMLEDEIGVDLRGETACFGGACET